MADLIEDDEWTEGSDENESILTPLQRIQKYAYHTIPLVRNRTAHKVLEEFRSSPPEEVIKYLPDIMKTVIGMADESIFRVQLLDQIPHIAAQAVLCSSKVSTFKNIVGEYLIPWLVRNLGCTENKLITHSILIQLIEQGFISKLQAEIQVCPTILALTKLETVDLNTNAINLMSKLAPLLGWDVTERVLLGRLVELCSSHLVGIRRVCVAHFGNFCAVISKDSVEKILLPEYLTLCVDKEWEVRKACAEVVTYLSCACSQDSRTSKLAPAFGKLLQDESRLVKISAFQSLGLVISTFAVPSLIKMGYNSSGELVLINDDGDEFMVSSLSLSLTEKFCHLLFDVKENDRTLFDDDCVSNDGVDVMLNHVDINSDNSNVENLSTLVKANNDIDNLIDGRERLVNSEIQDSKSSSNVISNCDNIIETPEDDINKIQLIINKIVTQNTDTHDNENKVNINNNDTLEDDLHLFYSHNYWYVSPELPLDPSLVAAADDYIPILKGAGDSTDNPQDDSVRESTDNNNSTISVVEENDSENGRVILNNNVEKSEPPQTIVPQFLVDHYVSMIKHNFTVEHEKTYYCAYFLPAVVKTLGKENWYLLEEMVASLARDMQYKVRRAVASSLHELAILLGPELTTHSLSKLFDGFIKDLDEVRIGILRHLSSFFEIMNQPKRSTYLPRLAEFLQTDNEWNWRFREELAKQLLQSMELFNPPEIAKHMGALVIDLLSDRVAAVRQVALSLVTEMLSYISWDPSLSQNLLIKLAENFAHSKRWKRRQTFCLMCIEILKEDAVEPEQFVSNVMPHLLDLSWDPVINIRLVVARCLSKYIFQMEYFTDSYHYEALEAVLRRLQSDKDSDVRLSAEL